MSRLARQLFTLCLAILPLPCVAVCAHWVHGPLLRVMFVAVAGGVSLAWAYVLLSMVLGVADFPPRPGWLGSRERWRRSRGLCAVCGYDLRASPDRCPECGAPTN